MTNKIEYTNLNDLTVFKNYSYGDLKCSCCDSVMVGVYTCVGDENNDCNGYEWRGFCSNCEHVINTNDLQQTFTSYNETQIIE